VAIDRPDLYREIRGVLEQELTEWLCEELVERAAKAVIAIVATHITDEERRPYSSCLRQLRATVGSRGRE